MKKILLAVLFLVSLGASATECAVLAGFGMPTPQDVCKAKQRPKETILRSDGVTAAAMETVPPAVEIPGAIEIASTCHSFYASCVRTRGASDPTCGAVRDLCLAP